MTSTQTHPSSHLASRLTLPPTATATPRPITLDPRSPHLKVGFAQATFDAEGREALNPFFSRRIHHPSASSGVTIGRGYDMRYRSAPQVYRELRKAQVTPEAAQWLSQAAGKYGNDAHTFVSRYRDVAPVITLEQQKRLFEQVTAPEMIADIKRIFATQVVIATYGSVTWGSLPEKIQELVFDLRYRGDYTPTIRKTLQPLLTSGDYTRVKTLVEDTEFWRKHSVPSERIKARIALLNDTR